jgi:hypothetical protein
LAVSIYQTYEAEPSDIIFTKDDKIAHANATHCHICELPVKKDVHASQAEDDTCGANELASDITVRDHGHITGKYRGAAHNSCNLNCKLPKFYPVILHNLSGYDAHLCINSWGGNIKCIPQTDERYISFSKEVTVGKDDKGKPIKCELRFIDSLKFMASSIDSLLGNSKSYPNLGKFYQGKQSELLLKKGVYTYEYVDNVDVFDETELPRRGAFYSQLNECGITDKEYEHAYKV